MHQAANNQDRYPGIRSFESEEQSVFFGRSEEVAELFNLIKLKPLIILFSRSGLGKTSLLKAGLSPLLSDNRFFPLLIRVQDPHTSPTQTLLNELEPFIGQERLNRFGKGEAPLWEAFQAAEFTDARGRHASPVVLIDQFEELFNHSPEARHAFAASLADLAEGRLPDAVQQQLEAIPRRERRIEQRSWFTPPPVRFLLAIRSDRMSELHQLRSHIPSILHTRYELRPLGQAQAQAAIVKPAIAKGEAFSTLPFTYSTGAREDIIQNLANEKGEIESFQLQIICQQVENNVRQRQLTGERDLVVTSEDLGGARGIHDIHKNYYHNQLQQLQPQERLVAQRLLEEGLIADGRRISVAEAVVKTRHQADDELIAKLLDSRLIRPENTRLGRAYEISHDTLVAPILEAFEKRRLQEERETAERQFQEQQARLEEEQRRYQEERRKRRRNRNLAIAAILLAVLATAAMSFAIIQRQKASEQAKEAVRSRLKAEKAEQEAIKAKAGLEEALDTANVAKDLAEKQKSLAEQEKENADRALLQAKRAGEQAEESARQAEKLRLEANDQREQAQLEKQQAVQAKENMEIARKEAVSARKKVENLLKENTSITAEVIAERDRAEKALQSFRKAQDQIAGRLVDMAREDIRQLDYDSAMVKLEQIPNFLGEYPPLAEAMMGLAYYYGESGQMEKAAALAQAAARAAGKTQSAEGPGLPYDDSPITGQQLQQWLKKLNPEYYEELKWQYYPRMERVEGGKFFLGCLEPDCAQEKHPEVQLSTFNIAQTETTVWQYHLFVSATEREMPPEPSWGWQGNHPIVGVSWYDALAYSNWLSQQQELNPAYQLQDVPKDPNQLHEENYDWQHVWDRTANGYRLPTEAEWEYTARGGQKQLTSLYSGGSVLDKVAWHKGNSRQGTQPVAKRAAVHPVFDMYDMSGNSWEWCWDYYQKKAPSSPLLNPAGPQKGKERIVRGGSWNDNTEFSFQSTNRNYSEPTARQPYDGFRVARNE